MWRLKNQVLCFPKSIVALVGLLIVIAANCAAAQNTSAIPGGNIRGIRHVLDLTIKLDPASHYWRQSPDGSPVATLGVIMRISAHSQEANFFGNVRATVPDFDPIKGSREHEVWKDAKCHHERGFPKITVLGVYGSITAGKKESNISARYRQIGLMLPSDEVIPSERLSGGIDNVGPFIATRTKTKRSKLFVDLKLHILPCDLRTGALIATSTPRQKSMSVKKNVSRVEMEAIGDGGH
jgi:hypothetical protein